MNFSMLIYIALIAFALGCGKTQLSTLPPITDANEIIHGHTVKDKEALGNSVVALIAQSDDGQALCSGSIIASDIILTAAHCVENDPEHLTILFDRQIKSTKTQMRRQADRFEQNPRWHNPTSRGDGDLALIHFKGGLPSGYAPILLAGKNVDLSAGTEVLMLGYGISNARRDSGSGTLRETQTTITGKNSSTEIITDGHRNSVCFGDSGGPAFVKNGDHYVQWGVASSVANKDCNESSIHTSVIGYRSWIKSTSADLRKNSR